MALRYLSCDVFKFLVGELEAPNVEISRNFLLLLFFFAVFSMGREAKKNADQAPSMNSNKTTFDSKSVDSKHELNPTGLMQKASHGEFHNGTLQYLRWKC